MKKIISIVKLWLSDFFNLLFPSDEWIKKNEREKELYEINAS